MGTVWRNHILFSLINLRESLLFNSVAQLCPNLSDPMDCSTPGFTIHHQLPACSNSSPSSWWCHPTISSFVVPFSSSLQSLPASGFFPMNQFFTSGPKFWSFSFSISPSNEHSGLIAFRTNWLDLLAVHGTLKSLLQHHSSKAAILQRSAFFVIQLSQKTIALTKWTFVGEAVSLIFNMLSRLVIGEGNGYPPQYSCLDNPLDGGAW